MKTETLTLKEDIVIQPGTVIPRLSPRDEPIQWSKTYKAGSQISKCDIFNSYTVEVLPDLNLLHSPITVSGLLEYLWEKALSQGCEIAVEEDDRKKFNMFEGEYGQGNYITYFLSTSLDDAREQAKKWVENSNLPVGFKYGVLS